MSQEKKIKIGYIVLIFFCLIILSSIIQFTVSLFDGYNWVNESTSGKYVKCHNGTVYFFSYKELKEKSSVVVCGQIIKIRDNFNVSFEKGLYINTTLKQYDR